MVSIGKAERVLFGAYLQLDCGPIGAWIVTERILGFPSGVDGNLVSSIKVEVKKKHLSNGWPFSCFAAHLIEQDLF